MRRFQTLVLCAFLLIPVYSWGGATRFGERLCNDEAFRCIIIKSGQTWSGLWPDAAERDQIRRLNRMNTRLRPGMKIAVPKDPNFFSDSKNLPFPEKIEASGKQIQVNLSDLAWGAYDAEGNLLKWGPMSGGKSWCPDIDSSCRTPSGEFWVYTKRGGACKSGKYPLPTGGAPMPYCMFFQGGYAIHGSPEVPGYNASHGCVRVYSEDAKWLNEDFIGAVDRELNPVKVVIREDS